ncbi:hypothetical protein RclHR1_02890002 [Rhizophagus clarus]|nr:hypothetical protein RclHR1_02890002 [Rhizophagus clarus]
MEYANKGNLRKNLVELTSSWKQRLSMLYKIIESLEKIHERDLVYYNLHDGNILCIGKYGKYGIYISDYLGSYQSTKSFSNKDNIYGVIPFIAPEVLRGESYTPSSDIYSFSMIMWEFTSGIPPFNNKAHDHKLALSICRGERPEIIENTPQCYVDLMKKCWDKNPLKRPSALEVLNIIKKWIFRSNSDEINELKSNIMEFINAPIGHNNLITESHPQAYYTSRLHNFTGEVINKILEYSVESSALQQKNSQFEQDIQNLESVLKEKEKALQVQIALVDNLTKQLEQSKLTDNQKLQFQTSQFNKEKNYLQNQLAQKETNILQFKDENLKLEKIAETYYQSSQNELKKIQMELDLQQRNSKLQEQRIDQLQQSTNFSEKENDNLYQENVNLMNKLENLIQQNNLLDDELSNYQLKDTIQNYNMNLNNDISKLNDNLKKYITDLNQDVNIEEIKKLLLLYECPTKISSLKDDQLLIQAVLQRHIIETIISHATKYFQNTGQHYHLESDIINKASSLSTLLTNISKYRTGNDKITHETLIKLRKQIYLVLDSCGFANICGENNTTYEHPFIAYCKKNLNNIMDEIRVVKDQEKITVENLAATIVCEVIKIFWFKLKVHESAVLQYAWIPSNVKVDETFMEKVNFEDIDDDESLYVNLCHFPLIGKDLTSNNQKVYIPAKVIVRKDKQIQQN